MLPYSRIQSAIYAGEYTVDVSFKDGTSGVIDLSDCLWGEMFEPLKDKNFFSQLRVDDAIRTIVWPNGADLAPEFLYERAKQHP